MMFPKTVEKLTMSMNFKKVTNMSNLCSIDANDLLIPGVIFTQRGFKLNHVRIWKIDYRLSTLGSSSCYHLCALVSAYKTADVILVRQLVATRLLRSLCSS